MTIEDYTRNLKGVNDGSDFSSEFLVSEIPRLMDAGTDLQLSWISMSPFGGAKSLCQKSRPASSDSNMPGKSF